MIPSYTATVDDILTTEAERELAWRRAWRRLIPVSDRLLWAIERLNEKDILKMSPSLRRRCRRLAERLSYESGLPRTPIEAHAWLLDLQDRLFDLVHGPERRQYDTKESEGWSDPADPAWWRALCEWLAEQSAAVLYGSIPAAFKPLLIPQLSRLRQRYALIHHRQGWRLALDWQEKLEALEAAREVAHAS